MKRMKLNIQLFAVTDVYVELTQKSQSVDGNYSIVNVSAYATTTGSSHNYNNISGTYTIDGSSYTFTTTLPYTTKVTLFSADHTIYHNADGTKTVDASFSLATGISAGTISASTSLTLTTIPRYAYFATQPQYSASTETTLDIYYKPDRTITGAQYRIKKTDGSYGDWYGLTVVSGNWYDTGGCTFRISGLEAKTNYVVQMRIQNVNVNWTNSNEVSTNMVTLAYPYATSVPPFNIGDQFTVGIYNPLSREYTLKLIDTNNTQVYSTTSSGTTVDIMTNDFKNSLYSSIPNAQNGIYYIDVAYRNNTSRTTGSNYYALENSCSPVEGKNSLIDTNAKTIAITGDDSYLIQNASITSVVINFNTRCFSTISEVTINGLTADIEEVSTDTDGNTNYKATLLLPASNLTSNIINVIFTDSRGFKTTSDITIINFYEYTPFSLTYPEINNFLNASSNVVQISFQGIYFDGTIKDTSNALTLKYRAKENGGEFSDYANITEYTLVGDTNVKQLFSGTNVEKATLISIANPLSTTGAWDYNKSYEVELSSGDIIVSQTYSIIVPKGVPIYDWYEKNDENFFDVNGTHTSINSSVAFNLDVGDSKSKSGKITLNGKELPNALGEYSESETDAYNCEYVNMLTGVVLYNSDDGTQGDITFSDSASNYKKLEIMYGANANNLNCKIIYTDRIAKTTGPIPLEAFWHDGTGAAGTFSSLYTITTSGLTYSSSLRYYFYSHESKPAIDTNNSIRVYKVVGYK